MADNGWIKLHRDIVNWEWYRDIPTFKLFMHLLIMANHQDKKWQGETIKTGQVLTGRKSLSEDTGLSEQQVRTAVKKLLKTGEISTSKSTNRFSIITICNYNAYQSLKTDINQQPNQQATSKQPQTRIKELKNITNTHQKPPKGGGYSADFLAFWEAYPRKVGKGAAYTVWKRIKPVNGTIQQILDAVACQRKTDQWKKDGGQFIPHPTTWLNQRRWEDEIQTQKHKDPYRRCSCGRILNPGRTECEMCEVKRLKEAL